MKRAHINPLPDLDAFDCKQREPPAAWPMTLSEHRTGEKVGKLEQSYYKLRLDGSS
jgi:hypothetical protein